MRYLIAVLIFLCSCAESRSDRRCSENQPVIEQGSSGNQRVVASIATSDDEAQMAVAALLSASGIRAGFSGSVIINVLVSPSEADRAIAILQSAARLNGHFLKVKVAGLESSSSTSEGSRN